MARIVTVHKKGSGGISVRCGRDVIGAVSRLEGGDERMTGRLARGPHYDRYAQLLSGDGAEMERRGVYVFSEAHDMRIDEEASLVVANDEIHFKPAVAFIVLRSGGLG
jgi:hypothetical protein